MVADVSRRVALRFLAPALAPSWTVPPAPVPPEPPSPAAIQWRPPMELGYHSLPRAGTLWGNSCPRRLGACPRLWSLGATRLRVDTEQRSSAAPALLSSAGLSCESWSIMKNMATELGIILIGYFTLVPAIQVRPRAHYQAACGCTPSTWRLPSEVGPLAGQFRCSPWHPLAGLWGRAPRPAGSTFDLDPLFWATQPQGSRVLGGHIGAGG